MNDGRNDRGAPPTNPYAQTAVAPSTQPNAPAAPPPYAPAAPYGAPPPAQNVAQQPYGTPYPAPYGAPPGYAAIQPAPQYAPNPYPPPQQQPYAPAYGYPPQPINVIVQNQVQQPYGYAPYGYVHPFDARKKDTALLYACLGLFFGLGGIQRFYLRDYGFGILYLLTGGLCAIGQIIDIIRLATMSQQDFDRRYNLVLRP